MSDEMPFNRIDDPISGRPVNDQLDGTESESVVLESESAVLEPESPAVESFETESLDLCAAELFEPFESTEPFETEALDFGAVETAEPFESTEPFETDAFEPRPVEMVEPAEPFEAASIGANPIEYQEPVPYTRNDYQSEWISPDSKSKNKKVRTSKEHKPRHTKRGSGYNDASFNTAQNFDGGSKPSRDRSQKNSGVKTFFIAFAGALVACAVAFGGLGLYSTFFGSSDTGRTTTNITVSGDDVTLAEAVAEKALPSVVSINVYTTQQSGYGFGQSTSALTQTSLGSGVIYSEDGYVITNYHVIEGAEQLKVVAEGGEYDASIVGSDPSSDIAVLKIKGASNLTPIELGDSDALTIGEWVMTIGSPFGLEQSVATGIVSATSRSTIMSTSTDSSTGTTMVYTNLIQTDAAINPGNSGGALVNAEGKLIGINTLIESYSGNYSGVGFAIPVNYAAELADQLIDGKTPTHAQLGVYPATVNASNAAFYNLKVSEGAYVSNIISGSGADKAGIEVGDIIVKVDDEKITSASDLILEVRKHDVGDTVKVVINRDGSEKTLEVKLGSDS